MIKGVIKECNIDQHGNVVVITDYYNDAGDCVHEHGITRFSFSVTPTRESMLAQIDKEIQDHATFLLKQPIIKKQNILLLQDLQKDLLEREVKVDDTTMVTKTHTVKTDGKNIIEMTEHGDGL